MNNRQSFQIDDPNYSISGLRTEHSELLQKLCERCADYVLIVEGESVSPNAAQELLQDTPPGRSLDSKFVYGILDRQGDVVG
ncbi:MAG TPA: hypothetical protein VFQ13_01735, partial [Anaerolineales bacterium]|nr:hypothetical protein [Anaerolineales bacterium]